MMIDDTPPQAGGRKPQPEPWVAASNAPPAEDDYVVWHNEQPIIGQWWCGQWRHDTHASLDDPIPITPAYWLDHTKLAGPSGGTGGGDQPPTPADALPWNIPNLTSEEHKDVDLAIPYNTSHPRQVRVRELIKRLALAAAGPRTTAATDGAADPARRQQTPQWVPVGEGFPKAYESVMVLSDCRPAGGGFGHYIAYRDSGMWCRRDSQGGLVSDVTHWMPLPAPPDGDAPPRPSQGRQPQLHELDVTPDPREQAEIDAMYAWERQSAGQAPPRQPQGQGAGAVPGELQPKSPPASPAPPAAQGAPTPAPTLTAAEREQVATVRESRAWELAHEDPESVVSQREYIEHTGQTLAIIDRCLLAAGAPTAASSTELRAALLELWNFVTAEVDMDTVSDRFGTVINNAGELLTRIREASAGADAAPAAEGGDNRE